MTLNDLKVPKGHALQDLNQGRLKGRLLSLSWSRAPIMKTHMLVKKEINQLLIVQPNTQLVKAQHITGRPPRRRLCPSAAATAVVASSLAVFSPHWCSLQAETASAFSAARLQTQVAPGRALPHWFHAYHWYCSW